jgi:hypothetical protein
LHPPADSSRPRTRRRRSRDLPAGELAAHLRHQAAGYYHHEAAAELVIAHDVWLHRPDFLDALVVAVPADGYGPATAFIEWDDVVDFLDECPCSASEAAVLRLAASIAGAPVGGALGDLVTGLDTRNIGLVLDAVAHANGLHDRSDRPPLSRPTPAAAGADPSETSS